MFRTLLTATTALVLMSGVGFAQSSYSSSTTETTKMVPTPPVDKETVTTTTRRTDTPNGVLIEKDVQGDEVTRPAGVATTQTRVHTQTTTDR
jgi:hypothetical protein